MQLFKNTLLLFLLLLLSGCSFLSDSLTYKDKTKAFVEALLQRDYKSCMAQMALESEQGQDVDVASLESGLEQFRTLIERNFGNNLHYRFVESEKKRSTVAGQGTPPNTTLAYIEFYNKDELGMFQVLFDDHSKKIINIQTLEVKAPVPDMGLFWLMGLLPLTVLTLNIYVLRGLKKSRLQRKWLKYLAVILLNVPTISYAAVGGFSFKLLYFQFLLGISFTLQGQLGSAWAFSIPLGGLYWLWRLRHYKKDYLYEQEIEASYIGHKED